MPGPLTMIRRTSGVVCLALWASACCDAPPTAATPIDPPAAPTLPRLSTVHVVGLVTDDRDNPIPDALVTAYGSSTTVKAMTDGQGRYEMTVSTSSNSLGVEVAAEKMGYERNAQFVRLLSEAAQDFRLYRAERLAAGESRTVTITADDSLCGVADFAWRCRTFRIVANESGTLVLQVVPSDPAEPGALEIRASNYLCCPPHVSFSVAAGAEVYVNVLTPWDLPRGAQTLTLNTSLQPQ